MDLDAIRRQMRTARRALSEDERSRAAGACIHNILHSAWYRNAETIGLYIPVAGEMDVSALMRTAEAEGRQVHLPRLMRGGREMSFVAYRVGDPMQPNRFGIPEPDGDPVPAIGLDLVIVPLVAFDRRGNRLGMGAGFYDRCFRHLRVPRRWRRPRLLGAAYAFQEADTLPRRPWDVPLDGVATESDLYIMDSRDT